MAGASITAFLAAAALGVVSGAAFALAWRWLFPPGAQSRFWNSMAAFTHKVVSADTGAEFVAVYKSLGAALGGYLWRNLAITAIAGGAVALAWVFALPPLQAMLGAQLAANPLARWFTDLQAVLLAVFIAATGVGLLWPDKRRALAPAPILRGADFALLQVNELFKPLIRRIGDVETRKVERALPAAVTAPIFITGLARSGTTTVLNALTRSTQVASHQYRDFPFLGAPLTWARWQGRVSKGAKAVERPHKDRILITKMSPEAYEEPLWRQFFPKAHAPGRNQRFSAGSSNPAFEAFFIDHLRKIMHLRGAGRYVSKGNYNLARIEYLARLFPDARFVVPVREPVAHVASLVRQHELFSGYAKDDPRIGIYLSAAGHFEFGPQRRPICLTAEAAAAAAKVWDEGDAVGYARQWAEVYGHVARLKASAIGDRILVVRYEDLCAQPEVLLKEITDFCALDDEDGAVAAFASEVSISEAPAPAAVEAARDLIEAIVSETAKALGYGARTRGKVMPKPAAAPSPDAQVSEA